MTHNDPQVIIVGAGPVGLTLAIDLARQGVASLVIDRKPAVQWTSRASCISRRSQEILQRIGVVPEFFQKALGWHSGRTFRGREQVYALEMPYDPARDAHAPMVNLQQFYTESFLLETARALPELIEIRWSTELAGFIQENEGVTVELRDLANDAASTVRAAYLAGCDGARSTVRNLLGLKLNGRTYENRYLIADIRMSDDIAQPVERWVWFDPESNPGSTTILHIQPDRVWRVDMQIGGQQTDEQLLAEDNVREAIDRHLAMMGLTGAWELVWHSVYRANALSLDSYRQGRVFLAGDAAHLVPIFGVRGMNSGIDDAHNLAWKLAAVLHGLGGPALADSYTSERRRACLENLGNAVRSTWFMSPPSAGFHLMRDSALLLAERAEWVRALINPRQSAAHVYNTSPVIAEQVKNGLQPGSVLPDVPLRGGGHLQSLLAEPGRFTLLFDARDPKFAARLAADRWPDDVELLPVGAADGVQLEDVDMDLLFEGAAGPILIIRPDEHIVGWAADVAEATDLLALGRGFKTAVRPEVFLSVEQAGQLVPPTPLEAVFEQLALAIDAGTQRIADVEAGARALESAYATSGSAVLQPN